MSLVIRLKVPIEMHYTVIPMGTSKVNSSPGVSVLVVFYYRATDVTCINTDKLIKVCQSQRAGKRDRTLDTKTNLQLKVELHLLYI